MSWTDAHLETAKRLWIEGKSASEIMRVLRLVANSKTWPSRNAVIGKLHRGGLTDGSRPQHRSMSAHVNVKKPSAPPVKRDRTNPIGPDAGRLLQRVAERRAFPSPPEPEPDGPVVPLMALQSHHCRWPIGSPSDHDFGFCGKRRAQGATYCASCIQTRKPYLPTPKVNGFNPDLRGVRRSA